MVQVEEQLLPTAFARAANVDSTFAYMGSLMTFLATGSETGGRFALMEYHTKPGMSLRLTSMSGNMSCPYVLEGACASTARTRL